MDGLDPDDDWAEQFNAPPEAFTFAEDAGSEASDGITVGGSTWRRMWSAPVPEPIMRRVEHVLRVLVGQ